MFEKEAEEWAIDYVCKDCSRYKECKSKEHCTCTEKIVLRNVLFLVPYRAVNCIQQ